MQLWPKLYLPFPMSTDKKGREMLEVSRDCTVPERQREKKRTDKTFAMLAAALEKSISGPPKKPYLPQGQDSPSTGPNGVPRPRYSQMSVPGAKILAIGRMNVLRQGRKRKLPQLWGLLTWKLNRAARAQRYQVPESPW